MVRRCTAFAAIALAACTPDVDRPRPTTTQRCSLRLRCSGLLLDGDPTTREAAFDHCRQLGGAVVAFNDVGEVERAELIQALDRSRVPYTVRGPVGDFEQRPTHVPKPDPERVDASDLVRRSGDVLIPDPGNSAKRLEIESEVCVGRDGRVVEVIPTRSSGSPAYDQHIVEEILKTWTFVPPALHDGATRVCATFTVETRLSRCGD